MKKIILNWFLVVAFAGIIFYLSTIPNPEPPIKFDHMDKILHGCFYGFFAVLVARALSVRRRLHKIITSSIAVFLAALYGILMEWYQAHLPTRESSTADAVANVVGAALGVLFYLCYIKFIRRKICDNND